MGDQPTAAEHAAMRRALRLAVADGVPLHPNPRVGCVILDAEGNTLGEGYHLGAGTAHAEVAALAAARGDVRGATAVVTLEPCDHTGRTGPCSQALLDAGIARVVIAQPDPTAQASGGAETLRQAGVEVIDGVLTEEARANNPAWTFAHEHGRPWVTWKFATTLDGRSAAADGSSRWVSSRAARIDTHRLRARSDTMLVGTNTVVVDNPSLTARDPDDQPLPQQPLRVVMGERDLPDDKAVFDAQAPSLHLRTRDLLVALETLYRDHDRHHVFLEGGPSLAASFLTAGLIDEVVVYVAPMLLGAGQSAIGDLGIHTISEARHLEITDVTAVGERDETNVRLTLQPKER